MSRVVAEYLADGLGLVLLLAWAAGARRAAGAARIEGREALLMPAPHEAAYQARETPSRRAISICGTPSTRCRRKAVRIGSSRQGRPPPRPGAGHPAWPSSPPACR